MKNEGLFLCAFIFLAIILLIMVCRSEKEHYAQLPANPTLAIAQLSDNTNDLDDRLTVIEKRAKDQEKAQSDSTSKVDSATTGIQMIT